MYGDCQVLPSLVGGGGGGGGSGNVVTSESLFSSQIRNPNLRSVAGFMAAGVAPFASFPCIVPKQEAGGVTRKEEEMESGSGSGHLDGLSCGEDHDDCTPSPQVPSPAAPTGKKKRYHRHTARQIQEMESLFMECPHPDDKQRLRLSQELGLKPRQVKFWFQNRRTQMKAQQDRADNLILRSENENLKNDNYRLQAAIRNVVCPNCGGPAMLGEMSLDEHHLRLENARLKDELERVSCIARRFSGGRTILSTSPLLLPPSLDLDMGVYSRHFHEQLPQQPVSAMGGCGDMLLASGIVDEGSPYAAGVLIMEAKKPLALELAMAAAEQLVCMCRTDEPLWKGGNGGGKVLDEEEHARLFPWPMDVKHQGGNGGFRMEGTRDMALVIMNSISLVDAFMDADKWMELFPSIVSKAKTIQIITPGISGNGSGSLQLMYAEIQVLSPLVPTREAFFLRYSQQNVEQGTWTIVDFPVDGIQDCLQTPLIRYRRRPSGCVIEDMPNGYSRVIWVEHAEVEDKPVHQIFAQFINSGMAFGATRWLSILQRQCEWLASLMARNISDLGVIPNLEVRKNMMKLSHRMVKTFCASITSSGCQSWTALSDSPDDTIRVSTRKNTQPGHPNGVILSAASTTWLPFSYHQVFDLLTDEQRRSQLDALSSGNSLLEVAHIANGSHPRNCVSLLRIDAASNSSHSVEVLLQESSTHPSGCSLIVYATIDVNAAQDLMSGEDPSYIPLLPTGFVVFPAPEPPAANTTASGPTGNGPASGCLLTIGMQELASAVPTAKLNLSSVTAVNHHLCSAVHQISTALSGGGPPYAAPPILDQ